MDEFDLPVFGFMVDWKDGVTERLEWRTDILPDIAGNEQARALRTTPRREFEVTLTLWGQERQLWDLWLHRMVGQEFMFPVWTDSFRMNGFGSFRNLIGLNEPSAVYEIKDGEFMLFRGETSLDFHLFKVTQTRQQSVVFEPPADDPKWSRNSRIWRAQRGRLVAATTATAVTDQASTAKVTVDCTREQPFESSVATLDAYMGIPVLTVEPNRRESIDQDYGWAFGETDGGTGRRYRQSDTGRATVRQKTNWWLKGRTAKTAFRQFLQQQRGAARVMWLPTFNNDMSMSRDAAMGSVSIYCKTFGFAYTGGVSSGREHIAIKTRNGYLYHRVTGTAAAPDGEERLTITPALPAALLMADVKRISWMDTARFENDRFEINHVTDMPGIATCSAVVKTVRNDRTPPAILSLPIPAAEKNDVPCGSEQSPIPRASDWRYLRVEYADNTDRSAPAYDDSQWLVSNGPFGNRSSGPEKPGQPGVFWPPVKTVLDPGSCWLRCRVSRGLKTFTTFADDIVTFYLNGELLFRSTQLGQTTYTLPEGHNGGLLAINWRDTAGGVWYFADDLPHGEF